MPKYNENGSIDLEYDHPQHGLIPFTASPDDVEELGRELYQRALNGEFGEIKEYVKTEPTPEQLAEQAKAEARQYLISTDWYVTRFAETGVAIPEEVTTKRAEARVML